MKMRKEMRNLRNHCKNVRQVKEKQEREKQGKREKEIKDILQHWLQSKFGYGKKPWRAIEGKKKLRPIPIKLYTCDRKWPDDVSKDFIIKVIKNLGFIVNTSLNGTGIILTIPKYKKGEKLTWAQDKIRKLNHDYSVYVNDEKSMARFYFREMLAELSNYDISKTKAYDDYILFENYKFGETMGIKEQITISSQCNKFLKRLCEQNNIKESRSDGKYLGICVFNNK